MSGQPALSPFRVQSVLRCASEGKTCHAPSAPRQTTRGGRSVVNGDPEAAPSAAHAAATEAVLGRSGVVTVRAAEWGSLEAWQRTTAADDALLRSAVEAPPPDPEEAPEIGPWNGCTSTI
ncbi:MAG TPA: hypothetical protein VGO26_06010, partial [Amnibacterium sp.]|nr:hypothetical protein [Amnibacterium sp.]